METPKQGHKRTILGGKMLAELPETPSHGVHINHPRRRNAYRNDRKPDLGSQTVRKRLLD